MQSTPFYQDVNLLVDFYKKSSNIFKGYYTFRSLLYLATYIWVRKFYGGKYDKRVTKVLKLSQKKRKAVSFLFAVTLLLYLPMLTNFSYSIDSEAVVDNSKDLLFSWLD